MMMIGDQTGGVVDDGRWLIFIALIVTVIMIEGLVRLMDKRAKAKRDNRPPWRKGRL